MPVYEPIDATEFRIVHILPGSFDDDIQCVLETRTSWVNTQYEALSYQWGDHSSLAPTIRLSHLQSHRTREGAANRQSKAREFQQRLFQRIPRPVVKFYRELRNFVGPGRNYWRHLLFVFSVVLGLIPNWMAVAYVFLHLPFIVVFLGERVIELVVETVETKPWLLIARRCSEWARGHRYLPNTAQLEWETVVVTPNLALALRYLRIPDRPRALWIDALCINQADEEEKKVQVRRMDFIYANAFAVLAWLGDYHGIGGAVERPECCQVTNGSCKHKEQISKAFTYMALRNSLRFLVKDSMGYGSGKEMLQDAIPGLVLLSKRGYWERLWVVQEAALATGPLKIQCGQHTCDFEHFNRAQYSVLHGGEDDAEVQGAFQSSWRFVLAFRDFRYSSWHDHSIVQPWSRRFYKVLAAGMTYFQPRLEDQLRKFYDQPYAQRLQLVMLRTSGYFECRDQRDRLHAILGVVDGAKKGRRAIANASSLVSSFYFQLPLSLYADLWLKQQIGDSWGLVLFRCFLGAVSGREKAQFWPHNKADYVVSNMAEATRALEATSSTGLGGAGTSGTFFRRLAIFIANETKSLSLLDAASLGGGGTAEILPSWVPCWQSKIADGAYEFAKAGRSRLAADSFRFIENGRVLELLGFECGRITDFRSIDSRVLASGMWEDVSDKLLAVPPESREKIAVILSGRTWSKRNDLLLLWLLRTLEPTTKGCILGAQLMLQKYGTAILGYTRRDGTRSLAYITAGKARRGDVLVHVPGCYHQLVLQVATLGRGPIRWTLAGLAITIEVAQNGRKKTGFGKSQWEALKEEGSLRWYAIE